jgi:NAD(P)-dependent dehydrogenase (short-subunit alcohol dehydrogenase family)
MRLFAKRSVCVSITVPIFAVLVGLLMKYGFSSWVRFDVVGPAVSPIPDDDLRRLLSLTSLLCVGCTRGIGAGIARAACAHGASVVIVGRSAPSEKLRSACPKLQFIAADLSSMRTAMDVVSMLKRRSIDTVLFTVGIVNGPVRRESSEGIELEVAVSFLSRFVMTNALLASDKLISTSTRKPRIFVIGFPGVPNVPQLDDFNWERSWKAWPSHMNTVVANDALVMGVARTQPDLVNIYGLNPGIIKTELMFDFLGGKDSLVSQIQQHWIGSVCPSVDDYATTAIQLLVSPQIENHGGASFNQYGERIKSSAWLLAKPENYQRIWTEAKKLQTRALAASESV